MNTDRNKNTKKLKGELMSIFSNIKDPKSFTNLKVYRELYPLVLDCFKYLDLQSSNNNTKYIKKLLEDSKNCSINILNNLAIGYNEYEVKNKVYFYNLSRDNLSKLQSFLVILSDLCLDENKVINIINSFQDKQKLLNGTIKKIESYSKPKN